MRVKRRYFPSKGTTTEVTGTISANMRKKTVSESSMLMLRAIFSVLAAGMLKTKMVIKACEINGIMRLTV